MIIIGTFQHSIELEQALAVLEKSGIPQKHMLVVLMDLEPKDLHQLMGKSNAFHSKPVQIGIAFATALSAIGASMGFILPWGPIFCGLAASLVGFGIGFGIGHISSKGSASRHPPKKRPEVTVIVECQEEQTAFVQEVMWTYSALSVGRCYSSQ